MSVPERKITAENIRNYQAAYYELYDLNDGFAHALAKLGMPSTRAGERKRIKGIETRETEDGSTIEVYGFFGEGQDYLDSGEYDKAINSCTIAIELNPQHCYAYFVRGMAHLMKGDYEQANDDFWEAVELNPLRIADLDEESREFVNKMPNGVQGIMADCLGKSYQHIGIACHKLDWLDDALEAYNEAIKIIQDNARLYYYRATIYVEFDEPDKAIADCDKALALLPDLAAAYSTRGSGYQMKDEYEKAIADFNRFLFEKPNSPATLSSRSTCYHNLNDYLTAISDLNKALKIDPTFQQGYYNRAVTFMEMGEYKKALDDINEAIRLDEENYDAIYLRKTILEKLSNK